MFGVYVLDIVHIYNDYKYKYTQLGGLITPGAAEGKQSRGVYCVYSISNFYYLY